jgi:hypothetical protein
MKRLFVILSVGLLALAFSQSWNMATAPLMTRWAQEVSAELPHPEYPRPQLVRPRWQNLNGLWNYQLTALDSEAPATFQGEILVPFPIESALSGVMARVDGELLWYQRNFAVPDDWAGERILLHFGAVDWETTVWVNGQELGTHRGGYTPFSFDITDALVPGEQSLLVRVWDPSDLGTQPRGKQVRYPENIWYTPTTGIWQTVWLEPVPGLSIETIRLMPDIDNERLSVTAQLSDEAEGDIRVSVYAEGEQVAQITEPVTTELVIPLPDARLWSPDDPFLYDLTIELLQDGVVLDSVESYAGMRKIALGQDDSGVLRLFLNNEPLFQYGPLDQGFWPDGLYTPPTDAALRYDLEVTRALGFNMVRKHVKIESARWYHWADRLGLLVWQDMPNGDAHVGYGGGEIQRTAESAAQFEFELKRMVDAFYNHPSVVMWVIFNEGWGQYDTARLTDWLTDYDPTRLVNSASGWNDLGTGDVHDIHSYPGPEAPPPSDTRAVVLGEFGGLGLPLSGHTWQTEDNWGYVSYPDAEALTEAYEALLLRLRELIDYSGLAAAVYTQTTDVEIEVNGLMTYDREIIKMPEDRVREANLALYAPPPTRLTLVATAEAGEPVLWHYTTNAPPDNWFMPEFDDTDWQTGAAGFGTPDAPASVIGTDWQSAEIWLRHSFELTADPAQLDRLILRVHHDDDMVIYLNGERIVTLPYYTFRYVDVSRHDALRAALRPGRNVLAVYGKHSWGPRYMDAGLFGFIRRED